MPQTFRLSFLSKLHTCMRGLTSFQFSAARYALAKAAPGVREIYQYVCTEYVNRIESMQCWVCILSRGAPLTHHSTSAHLQGTHIHIHIHIHIHTYSTHVPPFPFPLPYVHAFSRPRLNSTSPKASAHAPPRTRINKVDFPKRSPLYRFGARKQCDIFFALEAHGRGDAPYECCVYVCTYRSCIHVCSWSSSFPSSSSSSSGEMEYVHTYICDGVVARMNISIVPTSTRAVRYDTARFPPCMHVVYSRDQLSSTICDRDPIPHVTPTFRP